MAIESREINGSPSEAKYLWALQRIFHGGSRNIPSCFMPQKPEISSGLLDHLAGMQTLPFLTRALTIEYYFA